MIGNLGGLHGDRVANVAFSILYCATKSRARTGHCRCQILLYTHLQPPIPVKDDREHCVIDPGLRLQAYHSASLETKVIGSTLLFYKPLHILLPLVQEQIPP